MPRALAPSERRAFGRRETLIHGLVRVAGRAPEACIVRNISTGGALLEMPPALDPQGPFRLVVEAKGIDVQCAPRRREGHMLGVEFLDQGQAGAQFMRQSADAPKLPDAGPGGQATPAAGAPAAVQRRGDVVLAVPGEDMRRLLAG